MCSRRKKDLHFISSSVMTSMHVVQRNFLSRGLLVSRQATRRQRDAGASLRTPLTRRNQAYFSSLSKASATQSVEFDSKHRWWAVPPANLVHLSIGGVYVFSMWTHGMTHALGVVSSAPLDWTHSDVLPVFSTAAVTLGITTGFLGSWVEKVGPRKAGFVGSLFWSSGLITTGAGVYLHSLPLVYLGYGALGGVGWGMMYLAPVTTIMKWFPDRKGFATGIALSAFGAGAAIAPTIIHSLIDSFSAAPEFIGPLADIQNITYGGVTLSTLDDGSQVIAESSVCGTPGDAVVVASESDLTKFCNITTGPGVYKLGTGDTGIAPALASIGALYGAAGLLGSRFMMIPHSDWTPKNMKSNREDRDTKCLETNDVGLPVSYVTTSTLQFPLLWLSVFGNATGGLALLSSSKLMITDIWSGAAPSIVSASFATSYVSALGIAMAAGRFGWSSLSDYVGRKNTYALFGVAIPIVGLAPALTHQAIVASHEGADIFSMLSLFYGGSVLAITFYGGLFSTLPAYIADLFGQKYAGAIHGKLLTAWATSAVVGPLGLASMRSIAVDNAIGDLLGSIQDKPLFQNTFGCSLDDTNTIQTLIDAKTITISRLMEVAPVGTVDPTPFLYDETCYAAAGLMTMSFFANLVIRPLDYVKISKELEQKNKSV